MMRILSISIAALLLSASAAYAQSSDTGLERELNLALSPEHPEPGQAVQLSIQTYAVDLDRSTVVWYANDKEIARGAAKTAVSVPAGKAGEETRILVVAEDEEGITASAEAVIRPTEIDLLWEAASYVPPFYRGRALPGADSPIRAHALARFQTAKGTRVPEADIIYTWYRNGSVAEKGRGKSSVLLQGPALFGTDSIRVVAESADRTLSGEASIRLAATDPFAMFYENHPLFGVLYHRALEGSVNTLENEQKVTAVPYFAGIRTPQDPSLIYEWRVNDGTIVPDPKEPQTLTITASGYTGAAQVALNLMSSNDVVLRATKEFELFFGERGSSFFSSLNPFGSGE